MNILCVDRARTQIAQFCQNTGDITYRKEGNIYYLKDIVIKFIKACNLTPEEIEWADIIFGSYWAKEKYGEKFSMKNPTEELKRIYYGSQTMYYVMVFDSNIRFEKHIVAKNEVAAKKKLTGWFDDEQTARNYAKGELRSRICYMEINLEKLKKAYKDFE